MEIHELVDMAMLRPGGACTKTGLMVWDVLNYNHPLLQEIDTSDLINSNFEFYEKDVDASPLNIYG